MTAATAKARRGEDAEDYASRTSRATIAEWIDEFARHMTRCVQCERYGKYGSGKAKPCAEGSRLRTRTCNATYREVGAMAYARFMSADLVVVTKGRPKPRTCRVCGCTERSPCMLRSGEACHWIDKDLCSASQCVRAPNGRDRRRRTS